MGPPARACACVRVLAPCAAVDSRAMVLYMHFSRGGHVVNHPEWVTWRSARAADSDEQQASDEEDTIDGRDAAAKQEL
eukprot:1567593-Pleurochrysis_carterae.AAC.2